MANEVDDVSLCSRIIKRESWYNNDSLYDENMFSADSNFLDTGTVQDGAIKTHFTSSNGIAEKTCDGLCDNVENTSASAIQSYRLTSHYIQSSNNVSFYNSQNYMAYHEMNTEECHSNVAFAECIRNDIVALPEINATMTPAAATATATATATDTNDYYSYPHHHHHHHHHEFEHAYNGDDNDDKHAMSQKKVQPIVVPVAKRRNTANRKERRRTQSINNAFSDLRDCIPNVPADTKLSKIKTLRLATSYISYLLEVLNSNDPVEGFKADLSNHAGKRNNTATTYYSHIKFSSIQHKMNKINADGIHSTHIFREENGKKSKGRTGWPQHVWALELKQEQQQL